jgi:uncharacterized metal-binding protein YceD (DUF177 family)
MADGTSETPSDPGSCPLDWSVATDDIGGRTLRATRTATAAECSMLARLLGLLGCRSLAVSYTIRAMAGGAYFVEGRLSASVTQACVVSLDPVEAEIDDVFTVEFRDPADIEPLMASEAAYDPDEPDDPEPIRHGQLYLGPAILDHLLLALDPYPRKPGVSLDQSASIGGGALRDNPFAVLGKLKPRT